MPSSYLVRAIGQVESSLRDLESAPKQGREGSPLAWLVFDASMRPGLQHLAVGEEIIVLTWLDRAERDTLEVHPRDDASTPLCGVFSTRSASRPNPIGLHRVKIASIEEGGVRLQVRDLEAVDGTPILDVKPVLGATQDA